MPRSSLTDDLRSRGLRPGAVLGAGMEGTVVDLGDGTVAKIWSWKTEAELRRLQGFYDAVAAAGFSLGTQRVLDVFEVGGRWTTRQVRLEGSPLWDRPGVSPPADDAQVVALVDVLAALAAVEPTPGMAALPVLTGERPFEPRVRFGSSLADLVEARVRSYAGPLGAAVTDLPAVVAAVTGRLRAHDESEPRLLHGDLVPGNVLVADGRPAAVLDFGFLSTVGDPAFDAAVAASVLDMYGPDARRVEARVDEAVVERFGHDPGRLAAYRAAYALVTAHCFSASGSDGHFDWCAAMLERGDVRAALA